MLKFQVSAFTILVSVVLCDDFKSAVASNSPELTSWYHAVSRSYQKKALEYVKISEMYFDDAIPYIYIPWAYRSGDYSEFVTKIPEVKESVFTTQYQNRSNTKLAFINTNLLLYKFIVQIETESQFKAFIAVIDKIKNIKYHNYDWEDQYKFSTLIGFKHYIKDGRKPEKTKISFTTSAEHEGHWHTIPAKEQQRQRLLAHLTSRLYAAVSVQSKQSLTEFLAFNELAPVHNFHTGWMNKYIDTNLQRFFLAFSQNSEEVSDAELLKKLLKLEELWSPKVVPDLSLKNKIVGCDF